MNKVFKSIVLFATIAIPILLVVLLDLFSENEYKKLPYFYDLHNEEFDPYYVQSVKCEPNFVDSIHQVLPFSLTNQDGKTVTQKDFEGQIYITDFIFTRCPNICIELSGEMARLQEVFKTYDEINFVSYSIDPEYDTPEVLTKYAERYQANTQKWTFLTGNKPVLANLARCGYFVVASQDGETIEDINHTNKMVLIDKEGHIRGYYDGTNSKSVDILITEVKILLKEYERKN